MIIGKIASHYGNILYFQQTHYSFQLGLSYLGTNYQSFRSVERNLPKHTSTYVFLIIKQIRMLYKENPGKDKLQVLNDEFIN